MFKKKIAFQLTSGLVVIVLISMLAIGIIFIHMFRQYTFESREKALLARAHSISEVMAEYSQNNGFMRGMGGFNRFLDTMTEAKVWITDSKGQPIILSGKGMEMGLSQYHLNNSDPLPQEAEIVIKEVLSGQESVSESFSSVYNEATLTVGVPILDSEYQVIGSVFLHAPVTGITQALDRAVNILILSLLAALLLAIGLGVFYSLLFTRPLKVMNRAALEMTRGNYSIRTDINREDELGQLGNSLDLLAFKLSYTIDQLFQEKGKLNDIISSISEGIVAFDSNLKPLSTNSALAQIMNYGTSYMNEALQKDLGSLGLNSYLEKVMSEKSSVYVLKEWVDKKLKFTLSPIMDNNGEVTGSVALVQDVSESEQLEELRRNFVANVSHEFRTPLTVIRGSLEALLDGTVSQNEDVLRYHQRIYTETRALERLVGDLLELSLLQSGKISMNIEKVHIHNLLSDTIKSIQTIADNKGIIIEFTSAQNIPPINGDYDRLRQLLVIFLDNAVKYSTENTIIAVDVNVSDKLMVTIRDQGFGITAEELPHIWDRFYKSDNSRKGNGTGLGLAIAKHLIALHEGIVLIESSPGIGTAIRLSFPLA